MELTREELKRIILEETQAVRMEALIKEITRRKFCQIMAMAGLATGCGSDYQLLHNMVPNEAGEPPPECIKNPQINPPLDDWDAWQQPIKLYDFMAQPAFGGDLVGMDLKVWQQIMQISILFSIF